jgi:hypothetical protein
MLMDFFVRIIFVRIINVLSGVKKPLIILKRVVNLCLNQNSSYFLPKKTKLSLFSS